MGNNHHYVPQFYLHNFTRDENSIAAYIIKSAKLIEFAGIRKQCYRIKAYKRQEIEDRLCAVEGSHADVARCIMQSDERFKWPQGMRHAVLEFVALNHVRNVHKAELIRASMDMMLEGLNEGNKGGEIYDDLKRQLAKHNDFVLETLGMYQTSVNVLSDLGIAIIANNTERGFVTSDNPVVVYNLLFQDVHGVSYRGEISKGLIVYMPVSSRRAVILYDKSIYRVKRINDCFVRSITEDDIKNLNLMVATNAQDCVYFDRKQASILAGDLSHFSLDRKPKELVVTQSVNEKDSTQMLQHVYEDFPDLEIALSFVSVPPAIVAKRMSLIRQRGIVKKPKNRHIQAVYRLISEERKTL